MKKPDSLSIRLPYPVSVNHIYVSCVGYKYVGGKRKAIVRKALSKYAKAYRVEVRNLFLDTFKGIIALDSEIFIHLIAYPPKDRRIRDIDNIQKALFDALQSYAFKNDTQVDGFTVKRGEIKRDTPKRGCVDVLIWRKKAMLEVVEEYTLPQSAYWDDGTKLVEAGTLHLTWLLEEQDLPDRDRNIISGYLKLCSLL